MAAGLDGAILKADIWFPSKPRLFLQPEKCHRIYQFNRSQLSSPFMGLEDIG